jgi:hypothetical protein
MKKSITSSARRIKTDSLVSIIIVTYNSKKHIESCINSILKQDYPHEIIVVDNTSCDGTVQYIRERYPDIKIIESGENRGYGAGNNIGVRNAIGDYLVILNPDTIVEKNWLRELISPIQDSSKLITTPKILVYDGSMINTCGNINHFTGLTFTRGLGENPEAYPEEELVSGISGCCFALRKEDYDKLGGFDETFFIYNEDSEFSWRANLKCFKILYVPKSVIRHDYRLKVGPEKIYYLEKNRYLILRKYLSRKDILTISPFLIITEVLTFGYSLKNGWNGVKYKIKAIKDGLTTKVKKENGDKSKLFNSLSPTIPVEQLTSNKVEKLVKILANKIFSWN